MVHFFQASNKQANSSNTTGKGSMAQLPLVLVYHGPLLFATFWELRHLLSPRCIRKKKCIPVGRKTEFLLGPGLFSGANLLLVSGSVTALLG